VDAGAVPSGVPRQHLDERTGLERERVDRGGQRLGGCAGAGRRPRPFRAGLRERAREIAHRLGGERRSLGQRDAEPTLQPQEQLHPTQAVEAQITIEGAVGTYARAAARLDLLEQLAHQPDHRGLGRGGRDDSARWLDLP
jgi:hypothetical protein